MELQGQNQPGSQSCQHVDDGGMSSNFGRAILVSQDSDLIVMKCRVVDSKFGFSLLPEERSFLTNCDRVRQEYRTQHLVGYYLVHYRMLVVVQVFRPLAQVPTS